MERMTSKEAKRKTEQVLKKYREAGYDFNGLQIKEICLGYEHGLGDKTEDYIDESLDWQTMKGFREGLEAGLDSHQIYICMGALEGRDITIKVPGLTDEQFDVVKGDTTKTQCRMDQIIQKYLGFLHGLTIDQVNAYGDPMIGGDVAREMRLGLEHGLTIEQADVCKETTADRAKAIREGLEKGITTEQAEFLAHPYWAADTLPIYNDVNGLLPKEIQKICYDICADPDCRTMEQAAEKYCREVLGRVAGALRDRLDLPEGKDLAVKVNENGSCQISAYDKGNMEDMEKVGDVYITEKPYEKYDLTEPAITIHADGRYRIKDEEKQKDDIFMITDMVQINGEDGSRAEYQDIDLFTSQLNFDPATGDLTLEPKDGDIDGPEVGEQDTDDRDTGDEEEDWDDNM